MFVADLDGPVLITSGSAEPLVDLTATVEQSTSGDFASRCRWDDLAPRAPADGLVEVVVCNDTGVMGLTMPGGPDDGTTASYVWLNEESGESGPIGWGAGVVLVGEVCARGQSAGQDLCP